MMALGAVGGIVGAMGAASAGQSQASLYAYQAAVARVQQQEAEEAAWYQYSAGYSKAEQQGLQGKQQLGQIVAAQGASGLEVYGGGTSGNVRSSAREINMLNEETINNNAQWQGWQDLVQANDYSNQANLDLYASKVTQDAANVNAMSSLIGGFGQSISGAMRSSQVGSGFGFV
jgi:hypothetical protein